VRSRTEGPRRAARTLLLCGPLWLVPTAQAVDAAAPSASQVERAVTAVRTDPLLGGTRTERKLHWKSDDTPDEPAAPRKDREPSWLLDLARWLSESARALMWLLGATAVAVLAVFLRRWILARADAVDGRAIVLPSHVRDLDIRPESLPDDIAGAARALWQRGEARACLSLLYRGALSRLVHEHAVPIHGSSTEGECVQLAAGVLPAQGSAFFARLVQEWLSAVYAARAPQAEAVLALCDQFDASLPRRVTERAA